MRILLVGSGGREHALAKAISRSPRLTRLFCAPGNPGIEQVAHEMVRIEADDVQGLAQFAKEHRIDMTVIGPEAPLVLGLADLIRKDGGLVFGPNKEAAALEGSKIFSKKILKKYLIPTATYHVFDDAIEAKTYLIEKPIYPVVIKADGLAAGKGVVIATDEDQALNAIDRMMIDREFGDSGAKIIIEECLQGTEVSIHMITDGRTLIPLETVRDHKAIFDGDLGPNTGGMGTVSPSPFVTPELYGQIESQVLVPMVHAMNREGKPFHGLLYAGLMITSSGPKVLEFNVRFGDPEAQVILSRLKTDVLDLFEASAKEQLAKLDPPEFDPRAAVCVVLASKGYPGPYEKGAIIEGLEEANAMPDVEVFHAGTRKSLGHIVASGGRVLGVTALGDDIEDARRKAYEAVSKISFDGMQIRTDIGTAGPACVVKKPETPY